LRADGRRQCRLVRYSSCRTCTRNVLVRRPRRCACLVNHRHGTAAVRASPEQASCPLAPISVPSRGSAIPRA
jgi:hypothetical protein